jgi:hypothetical protein
MVIYLTNHANMGTSADEQYVMQYANYVVLRNWNLKTRMIILIK